MSRVVIGGALALLGAAPAVAAPRVLFPSDRFTVRDARQSTGKRVHLPLRAAPSSADLRRDPPRQPARRLRPRSAPRDPLRPLREPRAGGARDHAADRPRRDADRVSTGSCGTPRPTRSTRTRSSSSRRADLPDRRARARRRPRGVGEVHDDERDAAAAADGLGDRLRQRVHAGEDRADGPRPEDRQGFQAPAVTGMRRLVQTTDRRPLSPEDVVNLAGTTGSTRSARSLRRSGRAGTTRFARRRRAARRRRPARRGSASR